MNINSIIDRILPEVIEYRHQIHANPELAGNEFDTSKLVRQILSKTAIELEKPYLETDVVGLLNGDKEGKCVGLRADMDALPLQELNDLPYKSRKDGVMHACGHDGNTAMLLGAALVLDEIKDQLKGSVKFVFQPGEEVVALGKKLVEAGALENPKPDAVFALHGSSGHPTGAICSRVGAIMAAAGFFKIRIIGRGGHCSKPETCIDPIVIGCQIVNNLQTIVSRHFGPQDATCLSICRFSGGENSNVIPEDVILEGSTRFLDYEIGKQFPELIEKVIKGVCDSYGAKYEFDYELPYIPTVNSAEHVETAKEFATEYLGQDLWVELPLSSMGGEDFSYYLRECGGAFCDIGMGEDHPAIHNPMFDFNDDALRNGIAFMVNMVLRTMEK